MKVKELLDLLSNPEIPADAEIVVKQFERGDEPEWYSRGTLFPDLGSSAPSSPTDLDVLKLYITNHGYVERHTLESYPYNQDVDSDDDDGEDMLVIK
jgi:hypothetical protein